MSEEQPWWHSTPDEPPVDSVLEEGMKLFAVLRDWAVESGALAAVTELTTNAATSASAYLAEIQETQEELQSEVDEPVVRCADCPVCRGLDALEATNPQWAATARSAVTGLNTLLSGLLPGARPQQ